jgi:hypothetical protein
MARQSIWNASGDYIKVNSLLTCVRGSLWIRRGRGPSPWFSIQLVVCILCHYLLYMYCVGTIAGFSIVVHVLHLCWHCVCHLGVYMVFSELRCALEVVSVGG